MPQQDAPRVFVTYSQDTGEHMAQVERFAAFLRARSGLDVYLDQWADNVRVDWSLWAGEQLDKADYVIVVASPDYKQRAEGRAAPEIGRGAQYEAARLRDMLTENLRDATRRILPVVLPGRSIEELPSFLNPYSTTRYMIDTIDDEGVAGLLAAITGAGSRSAPRRGAWHGAGERPDFVLLGEIAWDTHDPRTRPGEATIAGARYEHSIVLRGGAHGFVEVDLGGRYAGLTAVAGVLDDAAEPFQVADFQVLVDGRVRAKATTSHGKPVKIDADLTGATRLRLEMSRPGAGYSPLHQGHGGRAAEIAWGDPVLR